MAHEYCGAVKESAPLLFWQPGRKKLAINPCKMHIRASNDENENDSKDLCRIPIKWVRPDEATIIDRMHRRYSPCESRE